MKNALFGSAAALAVLALSVSSYLSHQKGPVAWPVVTQPATYAEAKALLGSPKISGQTVAYRLVNGSNIPYVDGASASWILENGVLTVSFDAAGHAERFDFLPSSAANVVR